MNRHYTIGMTVSELEFESHGLPYSVQTVNMAIQLKKESLHYGRQNYEDVRLNVYENGKLTRTIDESRLEQAIVDHMGQSIEETRLQSRARRPAVKRR